MLAVLRAIFAIALVLGLFVLAVWGLVALVGLQASLVWAGVAGALAWVVKAEVEKRREFGRLLADRKREQYDDFLQFFASNLGQSDGTIVGEATEYRKWSLKLTLIGSDDVVTAWKAARALGDGGLHDEEIDEDERQRRLLRMMRVWGDLLLAMRRDTGHIDSKLKRSDVFATFVNNLGDMSVVLDADESEAG